ncbi:MAG: peptidase M3 [Planctomycetota bacterium]|nr:MAG: peptidase M3 [Planctomycetota bacterium]
MQLTMTPDVGLPKRRFVPEGFDSADPEQLRAQFERLEAQEITSAEELKSFLLDWSELASQVDAGLARRYVAMTCDTKDEAIKASYLAFERDVIPEWSKLDDKLNRKFLASPLRSELEEDFAVFVRDRQRAAEIFRPENTELAAQDSELSAKYSEIQGAIEVEFRGEKLTAQQCAAKLEEPDRATREESWQVLGKRRLQDVPAINELWEKQLGLRTRIAQNADFGDYRDYRFALCGRFDYTPQDCEAFHDAVEKVVVPAVAKLMEERKQKLGLDSLRPWDLRVGISGRDPVKPFDNEQGYIDITRKLFEAVDPVFTADFDLLVRNKLLDLMSRPGKAPGGYMYPIEDMRLPFIFINGVGRHDDVQTLLHEGGHGFHTLAVRDQDLGDYREPPIEFAEVASMSMEMLGLEQLGTVYADGDANEAYVSHMNDVLSTFTWVATIDAFQHWIYTHEGHSAEERVAAWTEIRTRFAPWIDWTGIEEHRDHEWQRQGHIFGSPFYYIEYAIAQIGALQVWRNERKDHDGAVAAYRKALALGGSRPLPELFAAAGLRFAMDASILKELVSDVIEQRARRAG